MSGTNPLPLLFPLALPLPSKTLLLPAEGLVIEPRMFLSCGVGADSTVEERERREKAKNVEHLIMKDVFYRNEGTC